MSAGGKQSICNLRRRYCIKKKATFADKCTSKFFFLLNEMFRLEDSSNLVLMYICEIKRRYQEEIADAESKAYIRLTERFVNFSDDDNALRILRTDFVDNLALLICIAYTLRLERN